MRSRRHVARSTAGGLLVMSGPSSVRTDREDVSIKRDGTLEEADTAAW
jgi:hypothetical protein